MGEGLDPQDDARAALVGRVVTVPGDLRVHAAQVPYVERDVEQKVAEALGPGRAVLLQETADADALAALGITGVIKYLREQQEKLQ